MYKYNNNYTSRAERKENILGTYILYYTHNDIVNIMYRNVSEHARERLKETIAVEYATDDDDPKKM